MDLAYSRQPFRFNSANARMYAEQSWQARRERKAMLEAEAAKGRQSTPQSERIAQQIAKLERMMDETEKPIELQRLAGAHEKLFRAWRELTEEARKHAGRFGVRKAPVLIDLPHKAAADSLNDPQQ